MKHRVGMVASRGGAERNRGWRELGLWGWWAIAESGVRAKLIVAPLPCVDGMAGPSERVEDLAIEELVAKLVDEALAVPFSQGLPNAMNRLVTPSRARQARACCATNSSRNTSGSWPGGRGHGRLRSPHTRRSRRP